MFSERNSCILNSVLYFYSHITRVLYSIDLLQQYNNALIFLLSKQLLLGQVIFLSLCRDLKGRKKRIRDMKTSKLK